MTTLVVDLDARIASSARFGADTVFGYFQHNELRWWRKLSERSLYREQEHRVAKIFSRVGKGRVLEIGPGFGRITSLLRRSGVDLTLIECNVHALKYLAKHYPNAELIEADVMRCEVKQEFDLVVAVEVLVHIPDIPAFMDKISHALVRGGSAIVSLTPAAWYRKNVNGRSVAHRGVDPREFEEMIAANFSIRTVTHSRGGENYLYWLEKR